MSVILFKIAAVRNISVHHIISHHPWDAHPSRFQVLKMQRGWWGPTINSKLELLTWGRFGKVYPGGRLKQTEMLLISEIDRRSSSLNQERKRSWNSSACTTIQQSQRISSRSTGGLAASTKCHTLCLYSVQPRVFIHTWEPPWTTRELQRIVETLNFLPTWFPCFGIQQIFVVPKAVGCHRLAQVTSSNFTRHHTLVASTPTSAKLPGEFFPCSPGLHVGIGRGPELEKSPGPPEPSSSWSTRSPGSQSRCASLMLSTLETCPHWRCYVGG